MTGTKRSPFPIPAAHVTFRSTPVCLALNGVGLVFSAALFIPVVSETLRIRPLHGIVATWMMLAAVDAATLAYRLKGLSPLYRWLDVVEGIVTAAFCGVLVYLSGTAENFIWLFYLAHTVMAATMGMTLPNILVISGGPAVLGVAFGLRGDVASATLSWMAGALGLALYSVVARAHDNLEFSRRREAALKISLSQLRVSQERTRIARDLHDGVGAELAGLVWRLRSLEQGSQMVTPEHELAAVERRIAVAIADLRKVVLDLREQPCDWQELMTTLRGKCKELCQGTTLEFSVKGSTPAGAVIPESSDAQRIVTELVRNAIQHAAPSRIGVEIAALTDGPERRLHLCVTDDGKGLPAASWRSSAGGLRNVQARVAELRGRVEVQSSSSGTRVQVTIPLVQAEAPTVAA